MGYRFEFMTSKYFDFYILVSVCGVRIDTTLFYRCVWCWGNSFYFSVCGTSLFLYLFPHKWSILIAENSVFKKLLYILSYE